MKQDHAQFAAATAYGATDGETALARVHRFIPLVRKSAWHIYGGGRDGLEVEDLMQAGMVALTEAAQGHTGTGEDGFAAYAKLRVRGAMYDCLRRTLPESRTAVRRRTRLAEAQRTLHAELGREPDVAELAARTGYTPAQVREAQQAGIHLQQLDSAYDDSDAAFADERPDAFTLLASLQDGERVHAAMHDLPDRLKLVLQLYFVEELNLKEIAAVLEVSVPRVHQLKAQALGKLKVAMDSG